MEGNDDENRIQLPPVVDSSSAVNSNSNAQLNFPTLHSLANHQQQFSHLQIPAHNHTQISTPTSLNSNQLKKNGTGRVRVKMACDRCKRQKTKCNGDYPCYGCSKHNHPCNYTTLRQDGKDVSPTSRASSLNVSQPLKSISYSSINPTIKVTSKSNSNSNSDSSDYVKYLENKLLEMENRLKQIESPTILQTSFERNQFTMSKDKYRVMRRYQNILPTRLAETIQEALPIEEFKDLIVPRIQFYGWNMSNNRWLKQRSLSPMVNLVDLVEDTYLVDWLLKYFMTKINPLFSIIHEKIFYDQYDKFISDLKINDISKSTRLYSSIVYLILSISIRYSENDPSLPPFVKEQIKDDLEENLFESAYDVVQKLSFEWQSFELIQSWVLITFYLRTTHRQNSSYMALGTAIRMTKGMSLNLNILPEKYYQNSYERQRAKNIFWLVYTFDKLLSFQSGKDFEIYDETINHLLPSLNSNDSWVSKLSLGLIHLSKISSEIQKFDINNYLNDDIFTKKILNDLKIWKDWFDLNSNDYDKLLVDHANLIYHDVVLNFNNKVLFKFLDKENFGNEDEGSKLKLLIFHSKQVLKIFESIDERLELLIPWWHTLALLFNTSLINLFLINFGLYDQNEAFANFFKALNFLIKLKSKAQMSEECIWVLKMLNHICIRRMNFSIKQLNHIGIDHGPGSVNKVRFYQFSKVNDSKETIPNKKRRKTKQQNEFESQNPEQFDFTNVDSLLGNLKWFDQWVMGFDEVEIEGDVETVL